MKKLTRLKIGIGALALALSGSTMAYDGLTSEVSHAVAGAVLAGAVAKGFEDSPNRGWIGFAVSTAAVVLVEGYNISRGSDRSSQMLDIYSHTLGAAIGAWLTDKYFLTPVVTQRSVSLLYQRSF